MKIYIGPYPTHNNLNKIKNFFTKTFFGIDTLEKPYSIIHIDNYDVWNMDETLAKIIVPMLKKLREIKHGAPYVDDEDVPENLRTPENYSYEETGDVDINFFKRWEYVIDEMIWSFEQELTDYELEFSEKYVGAKYWEQPEVKEHSQRMDNGRRLFAKYYRNLWD